MRPIPLSVRLLLLVLCVACTSTELTDTPAVAAVEITPPVASVEAGRTVALVARVTDAGGGTVGAAPVTWSSSNTDVATVSPAGVVSALSVGETRIAASSGGRSATATVTVTAREVASVQVTPLVVSVRVQRTAQLEARALDADGGTLSGRMITWSSSNPSVATISGQGVVTALAPGAATITATSEGVSGQAAVTVTPEPVASVSVSPTRDTLAVGTDRALTAVARDASGGELADRSVSWSVSDPNIASVSSTGVVTALAPGTVNVSAVSEGRVGQSVIVVLQRLADAITLTPSTGTVEVGSTVQLTAQVTDPSGNLLPDRVVTYVSDADAVATVSASGLVTARAPGTARITASSEGKTAVATFTVIEVPVATVSVTPASGSVIVGATRTLTAQPRSAGGALITGRTVTWTSGAPTVASVNAQGVVTALSPGTAVIAASVDGVSGLASVTVLARAVASVTVTPESPSVDEGTTVQLSAALRDASGALLTQRTVTWRSSNEAVAFVSSTGLVVGIRAGTAVITATSEGVSGTTSVTVR
jgi:uncharacterized protein YjdB